jgi:geranylgeranyl transferase type-2 subunit alpha
LQYTLEIQSQTEFSSKDPVATNSNNMEKRNAMKSQLIQNELEIVHNAIFTEPDDQTPWWYYRFLIQWANPSTQRTTESVVETTVMEHNYVDSFQSLLLNEIHVIKDLIETENNLCKWGYLTLHFILKIMESLENNSEDKRKEWMMEAEQCLSHLMDIDPDRIHRYESLM